MHDTGIRIAHWKSAAVLVSLAWVLCPPATAQAPRPDSPVDRWVTVSEAAAGLDLKAKDEAVAQALRKAVKQVCGTFIQAQTKTENYQAIYDKVLEDTTGYVIEHKVLKVRKDQDAGLTFVRVRARVSTRKFSHKWSNIAHTVNQANNPRVVIAIVEAIRWVDGRPRWMLGGPGTVQSKVEDFFLSKNIVLMDRKMAKKVSKRDIMLANIKDDTKAIAVIGAQFKADVVVTGRATSRYSRTLVVAETTMYQFVATLNIRAIQTDSARILVSKNYNATITTLHRGAGELKALAKLTEDSAPKILEAIAGAWRRRANVSRTVQLNIDGMDFTTWKRFKAELDKVRGLQALRLREITDAVANIDVEDRYTNENLAERLTELKVTSLEVKEITANRIRLKVAKKPRVESEAIGP